MVEEARLESVYTSKGYHGFESRSLRKIKACDIAGFFAERFSHPWVVPFGHASRARSESRSLRKKKGNPDGLPFFIFVFVLVFVRSSFSFWFSFSFYFTKYFLPFRM